IINCEILCLNFSFSYKNRILMKIEKLPVKISPSSRRWLLRPFVPGNPNQVEHILTRILSSNPKNRSQMYQRVSNKYKDFHKDIRDIFMKHYENVHHRIPSNKVLDQETKLIIGAYFSQFYALESTALFNPSIVVSPIHDPEAPELNFILTLRAIGEG